ncbi:MAG: hypothetical protein LBP39_01205 [Rickettsiales bacterium]|nr:hypothetical protein [Rickettsiales bacterium]
MFSKFLEGFASIVPFFYRSNPSIRYYPEDIYVNDWRIVGNLLRKAAREAGKRNSRYDSRSSKR